MWASLAVVLFVASVLPASAAQDPKAPAAQDPGLRLRDWAASGRAEAIRDLLSRSEPIIVDFRDEAGWTALMHAANAGHNSVVRLLLDAGASVDLENTARETALHLAAQQGRTESVQLLLKAGADFAARDADGRTPLFRAIERRHARVIELIQAAALASSNRRSPVRALSLQGETVPPTVVQWATAPYTDDALKEGIEGTVVLMALVRRDGSVGAVSVSMGLEKSLDESASRTVRTWKFAPATRAGQPVDVVVEIDVDFQLARER